MIVRATWIFNELDFINRFDSILFCEDFLHTHQPENAFEHRYYRLGSVIWIVRGRADRPGMPGGWPGPRETGPGVARYRETRGETGAGERQWVTGPTPVTSDQGSNINISGQWGGTYTTVTPTVTYSQQWPHVPIRVLNLENVMCW